MLPLEEEISNLKAKLKDAMLRLQGGRSHDSEDTDPNGVGLDIQSVLASRTLLPVLQKFPNCQLSNQ